MNKAEIRLQQILTEAGIPKDDYSVKDFSLIGDESESQLQEYAHDFLSECASDEAEYKANKRFPQGDDMNGDETW